MVKERLATGAAHLSCVQHRCISLSRAVDGRSVNGAVRAHAASSAFHVPFTPPPLQARFDVAFITLHASAVRS